MDRRPRALIEAMDAMALRIIRNQTSTRRYADEVALLVEDWSYRASAQELIAVLRAEIVKLEDEE